MESSEDVLRNSAYLYGLCPGEVFFFKLGSMGLKIPTTIEHFDHQYDLETSFSFQDNGQSVRHTYYISHIYQLWLEKKLGNPVTLFRCLFSSYADIFAAICLPARIIADFINIVL